METNARPVPASLSAVPVAAPSPAYTGKDAAVDSAMSDAERAAGYRLIIEEGPTRGTFVYKTLDSVTGEIVRQFPREEVIRMSVSEEYLKGTVADTAA